MLAALLLIGFVAALIATQAPQDPFTYDVF